MARDYKKEYANYHSKPAQVKNRAMRNAARAIMKKLQNQRDYSCYLKSDEI